MAAGPQAQAKLTWQYLKLVDQISDDFTSRDENARPAPKRRCDRTTCQCLIRLLKISNKTPRILANQKRQHWMSWRPVEARPTWCCRSCPAKLYGKSKSNSNLHIAHWKRKHPKELRKNSRHGRKTQRHSCQAKCFGMLWLPRTCKCSKEIAMAIGQMKSFGLARQLKKA